MVDKTKLHWLGCLLSGILVVLSSMADVEAQTQPKPFTATPEGPDLPPPTNQASSQTIPDNPFATHKVIQAHYQTIVKEKEKKEDLPLGPPPVPPPPAKVESLDLPKVEPIPPADTEISKPSPKQFQPKIKAQRKPANEVPPPPVGPKPARRPEKFSQPKHFSPVQEQPKSNSPKDIPSGWEKPHKSFHVPSPKPGPKENPVDWGKNSRSLDIPPPKMVPKQRPTNWGANAGGLDNPPPKMIPKNTDVPEKRIQKKPKKKAPASQSIKAFRIVGTPSTSKKTDVDKGPKLIEVPPGKTIVGKTEPPVASTKAESPKSPGVNLASIRLQKTGPKIGHVGQTESYVILVENTGTQPAVNLVVEDLIPETAVVVETEPKAVVSKEKLVWRLKSLSPGEQQRYTVQLRPLRAGEMRMKATASIRYFNMMKTTIYDLPLTIAAKIADKIRIGDKATLKIVIGNKGPGDYKDLLLKVRLPSSLKHPRGTDIEADVDLLKQGQTRTIGLDVVAVKRRKATAEVSIESKSGAKAVAYAETEVVGDSKLILKKTGTQILKRGVVSEYRIEVVNQGPIPAKNVVVVEELPPEVKFVAASNRGRYDIRTHRVEWTIERVMPGQVRAIGLRIQGRKAGEALNRVTAQASGHEPVGLTANLVVEDNGNGFSTQAGYNRLSPVNQR